ncbi:hypothetical protein F2Q69_00036310 [Brassica cretica]|uniref:Uncharacterized protein n=1 Tax=Brassica cretica TaxID=69181 RepID=A0A8S9SFR6_BRACR|nr:hypothetical protein F2Q69_00036310 [Brassica cretica]
MKSNGNSHVSTGKSPVAFDFKVIPEGSLESELQFQLIHFSEARNAAKGGSLIGLELLLIKDEQIIDFCKIVNSYSSWPFELYVSATVLDYAEIRIVCSSSSELTNGTLALSSVSSSRVFMDYDIQPTILFELIFSYRLQLCRMRGFIDWVFHLPNLMASSSILLLGSDPFSRENEEQNNQCMILSLSFLIPFVSLLNDDLWRPVYPSSKPVKRLGLAGSGYAGMVTER